MHSTERIDDLIAKARPYYDDTLPYHGWIHAEEVMRESDKLIAQMETTLHIVDRDLAILAAAWHDAGHEDKQAIEFESKEHYAVWLVKDQMSSDLEPSELDYIEQAILATQFGMRRSSPAEIILHYADIANMGFSYDDFLEHTLRLWREYGSPAWREFVAKSEKVILQSAEEASRELPLIGVAVDGPDGFPHMARANLARLKQEVQPQ